MRATSSLFRREFAAYFSGPIGYVALFGFLVLTGLQFNLALTLLNESGPRGVEYPMQVLLGGSEIPGPAQTAGVLFWGLFPAVTGIITMRLLAEERGSGTLELLLTAPIRDWQVVFAKFAACFAFYVVLWLPTLVYLPVLLDLHAEWKPAFTPFSIALISGLGLILLALTIFCCGGNGWLSIGFALIGGIGGGIGWYLHATNDPEKILLLTAGIDPYPALTSYLGILMAGAMFLAARPVRFQFGEEPTRGVDAGAAARTRVRVAFALEVVVRHRFARLSAGLFRERAGTLPPRLHPRRDRYPTARALRHGHAVLFVPHGAKLEAAASDK